MTGLPKMVGTAAVCGFAASAAFAHPTKLLGIMREARKWVRTSETARIDGSGTAKRQDTPLPPRPAIEMAPRHRGNGFDPLRRPMRAAPVIANLPGNRASSRLTLAPRQ